MTINAKFRAEYRNRTCAEDWILHSRSEVLRAATTLIPQMFFARAAELEPTPRGWNPQYSPESCCAKPLH